MRHSELSHVHRKCFARFATHWTFAEALGTIRTDAKMTTAEDPVAWVLPANKALAWPLALLQT